MLPGVVAVAARPTSPTMPMPQTVPPLAIGLGFAGLLPFVAAALAAWVGPRASHGIALQVLAAYGGVILSFLGAVHWGFALRTPSDDATAARLLLGVLPALVGWLALLLPLTAGLVLLAGALPVTAAAETVAARRGLVPNAYLRLRWLLSVLAGTCLLAGAMAGAMAAA